MATKWTETMGRRDPQPKENKKHSQAVISEPILNDGDTKSIDPTDVGHSDASISAPVSDAHEESQAGPASFASRPKIANTRRTHRPGERNGSRQRPNGTDMEVLSEGNSGFAPGSHRMGSPALNAVAKVTGYDDGRDSMEYEPLPSRSFLR